MPDELGRGNIPVPDPSLLTTEQLRRELGSLREVIETRLAGMDRATELIADELVKLTSDFVGRLDRMRADKNDQFKSEREYIMGQIDIVRAIAEERFAAVDTRFNERDARTQQAADEARISLDAALAAAKEAVSEQNKANTLAIDKSGAATQKQLDSLILQMNTSNESLNDKILELRGRLDRSEGKSQGGLALWGVIAGVILLVVAIVGVYLSAKGA